MDIFTRINSATDALDFEDFDNPDDTPVIRDAKFFAFLITRNTEENPSTETDRQLRLLLQDYESAVVDAMIEHFDAFSPLFVPDELVHSISPKELELLASLRNDDAGHRCEEETALNKDLEKLAMSFTAAVKSLVME